jgi:hypothetical protein
LPNWAEIFFVHHLRSFIRAVEATYPFGVRAELTYVSGVMDIVSNHDPRWQAEYVEAMRRLLAHHSDTPGQLSIFDIASLPQAGDLRMALLENYSQIRGDWSTDLTELQASKLHRAERNFAQEGAERVPDDELAARVLESAILCDALDSLAIRRSYNKFESRIQLVFGRQLEPAIHIGTCETSTTHFWVSTGVLERHGEKLLPRMVGHTSISQPPRQTVRVDELETYRETIGPWVPLSCEVT